METELKVLLLYLVIIVLTAAGFYISKRICRYDETESEVQEPDKIYGGSEGADLDELCE